MCQFGNVAMCQFGNMPIRQCVNLRIRKLEYDENETYFFFTGFGTSD